MRRVIVALLIFIGAPSLYTYGGNPDTSRNSPYPLGLKLMPDFCQLDSRYGRLPGGGSQYCAPTAISDVLVWLGQHGYPNLLPSDNDTCNDTGHAQFKLIETLGSEGYMNTDEETGTAPQDTMEGLQKYIRDQGYDAHIEWKGWRDGGRFTARDRVPSIQWLREGTQGDSNIIISVGWYTYNRRTNMYKRLGGHYVTVVGLDVRNKKVPLIYVNNPSFGSGKEPKPEVCRLVPMAGGHFEPWGEYRGHSAAGYYKIKGIPMRADAEVAVMDGGIQFTILKKPTPNVVSIPPTVQLADKDL